MAEAAQPAHGHRTFEHTADVGLMAWGRDLPEMFVEAAVGVAGLLTDTSHVRQRRAVPVEAEGETDEDLLVQWLEEVLFTYEVHGFAVGGAEIESVGSGCLSGRLLGERVDPSRHRPAGHVKAVTYHNLKIERVGDRYEVRVVLDT
jgi:SHS2 domain-containing protein